MARAGKTPKRVPKLWNFLAANEKQAKKTVKTCQQLPACTFGTTSFEFPLSENWLGPNLMQNLALVERFGRQAWPDL